MNPKELHRSVISLGHALTTNIHVITLARTLFDMYADDGNNPTKSEISEYTVSILNLVFSWHEVYPRGIRMYGVSRKPTVKYGKLYPKESDFNEAFEVPGFSCTRLFEIL